MTRRQFVGLHKPHILPVPGGYQLRSLSKAIVACCSIRELASPRGNWDYVLHRLELPDGDWRTDGRTSLTELW